jgi:hypothetical protein
MQQPLELEQQQQQEMGTTQSPKEDPAGLQSRASTFHRWNALLNKERFCNIMKIIGNSIRACNDVQLDVDGFT